MRSFSCSPHRAYHCFFSALRCLFLNRWQEYQSFELKKTRTEKLKYIIQEACACFPYPDYSFAYFARFSIFLFMLFVCIFREEERNCMFDSFFWCGMAWIFSFFVFCFFNYSALSMEEWNIMTSPKWLISANYIHRLHSFNFDLVPFIYHPITVSLKKKKHDRYIYRKVNAGIRRFWEIWPTMNHTKEDEIKKKGQNSQNHFVQKGKAVHDEWKWILYRLSCT